MLRTMIPVIYPDPVCFPWNVFQTRLSSRFYSSFFWGRLYGIILMTNGESTQECTHVTNLSTHRWISHTLEQNWTCLFKYTVVSRLYTHSDIKCAPSNFVLCTCESLLALSLELSSHLNLILPESFNQQTFTIDWWNNCNFKL